MKTDVERQIFQMAADTFAEPVEKIDRMSSPDTVDRWDSLTNLNFVLALEETFRCEISPEESDAMLDGMDVVLTVMAEKVDG